MQACPLLLQLTDWELPYCTTNKLINSCMFATFSCIADTEASAEQILYSADKGDTVAHWASIYTLYIFKQQRLQYDRNI